MLVVIGGERGVAGFTRAKISGIEGGDGFLGDSDGFAQHRFDELMRSDQGLIARVAELRDGDVEVAVGVEAPIAYCGVALLCMGHDEH
jgi:hypothetical protein